MNHEVKIAKTYCAATPEKRTGPSKEVASRTAGKTARKTKSDAVIALLARPQGATLDEMMKATGWQSHSVRGFLAGTVKKKLGHTIGSEVGEMGRVYCIIAEVK
ncbi:DUF3489 domain-containing protein [Qipengyuania spongiae]|uniref:DUF3489 domain-containing protein n=1 Tax=Qipengyuania spongiae TaxID=2909673 RepID=A0ABY5SXC5_9SPHN|nr:DUF3489 domain-containing protein [Qipengyuania spongiae]UVI39195.1 DUF3489 domain-containing protein [Qipengyuania spongiae]